MFIGREELDFFKYLMAFNDLMIEYKYNANKYLKQNYKNRSVFLFQN